MDRWDCAHNWVPILLVEVARQQRSTTAATESYRNETANFFTAFAEMVNKVSGDIRRLVALPHASEPLKSLTGGGNGQ